MRLLRLIPIALVALLASGCTSYQARMIRHDFARDSALALTANAGRQKVNATHHLGQAVGYEQARLEAGLAAQNARAGDDVNMVAQNYVDYFGALNSLESRYVKERAKIESNYAEVLELAVGFEALDAMAEDELRIADEAAKAAFAEGMKAAVATWDAYQKAHPPDLPDGKESDPPEENAEPPVEVPAEPAAE